MLFRGSVSLFYIDEWFENKEVEIVFLLEYLSKKNIR